MSRQALLDNENQTIGRMSLCLLPLLREFSGRYIKACKVPGAIKQLHIWMVFNWRANILANVLVAGWLSPANLVYIGISETIVVEADGRVTFDRGDEADQRVLSILCRLTAAVLAEFEEFILMVEMLPWGYVGLLSQCKEQRPSLIIMH